MRKKTSVPQPVDLKWTGDPHENWTAFKLRFELYIQAVNVENDERKLALLLMLAGRGALDVYKTFDLNPDQKLEYEAVMARFDQHFSPWRTEAFQRYIFRHRLQKECESVEQFVMDLRLKSQACEFGSQCDSMIRDQIVFGIRDDKTRMLLLKEPELTLLKAIRICQASQRSKVPLHTICIDDDSLDPVDPSDTRIKCERLEIPLSHFRGSSRQSPDCVVLHGGAEDELQDVKTMIVREDTLLFVDEGAQSSEESTADLDEDRKEISYMLDSAAVRHFSRPKRKAEAHYGHMMDPPETMSPVGFLDAQRRMMDVAPSCSAAAPDRTIYRQQQDKPYVKKPPNAFVIFMRENRGKIKDFARPKHSAEANAILGQMWKTMSPQDQEKYYHKAAEERRLHAEQHPDWSSKDNYGKKRKRQRNKAANE